MSQLTLTQIGRKRKRRSEKTPYSRTRKYRIPQYPTSRCKIVKLRYASTITLDPGAGTLVYHDYLANGMYDPDVTSTGHQPMGFDQWMAFYDHFKVIGSKCSVNFLNSGQTIATSNAICGIHLASSPGEVSAQTSESVREFPNSKWKTISYAQSRTNVVRTFSHKNYFCRKDGDKYHGSVSADPADAAYFEVWAVAADGSSQAEAIVCNVLIEYVAELSESKELIQS